MKFTHFIFLLLCVALTSCKKTPVHDSADTPSDQITLITNIDLTKSVRFDTRTSGTRELHFTIQLRNQQNESLKISSAQGDHLTMLINGETVTPKESRCLHSCSYYFDYSMGHILRPAPVEIVLTRHNGEILRNALLIPKFIELLAPTTPFAQVIPNINTVELRWSSEEPMQKLLLQGGGSACDPQSKSYAFNNSEASFVITDSLFPVPNSPCNGYTRLSAKLSYTKTLSPTYSNFAATETTLNEALQITLAEPKL